MRETRALLLGSRPHQRLLRRFEIAGEGLEGGLRDDLLFKQFRLPVVVLLRQLRLRIGPFGGGGRLVEQRFELPHVLLRFGERRLLLVDDILERRWVDTEQHIPFLERRVGLDGHLDHAPPDRREHGRHRKIDAGVGGEGMIVVHDQHQ